MNEQDRQAIDGLFGRLAEAERNSGPRDADAEDFIAQRISQQPAAPYLMAQTIVMQEYALQQAQARIEQMEQQVAEAEARPASGGGGLFGGLFGSGQQPARRSSVPSMPRAGAAPGAGYGQQPMGQQGARPGGAWGQQGGMAGQQGMGAQGMQPGMMNRGGGGGFLAGAAQTAMGVAGGVLLGSAISSMFTGGEANAAEAPAEDTSAADDTAADAGADDINASDEGGWFDGGGFFGGDEEF